MIEEGFENYLKQYQPNRVLFTQGDPGKCFYVIKDGLVGIVRREHDVENQIATVGPGEVLGELALLNPDETQVRSASAETITRVKCWQFDREQFDRLMEANEPFRQKILSYLGSRLRRTTGELAEANQVENQLYDLSFALLKLISDEQLYSNKNYQLNIDPSVKSLASRFNISPEQLKVFLSAPSAEKRLEMPEKHEKIALDVCQKLVAKAMDSIHFQTPFSGEYNQEKDDTDFTHLRDVCRAAEQLNRRLDQGIDQLTREKYDAIWERFEQIKTRLQNARQSPDESSTLTRRLGAFVKGIRKKLQSINEQSFHS